MCIEKKQENQNFFIDRHIAAFLAAKLGMDQRLNYKYYNEISKRFLDNNAITALIMLTIAQDRLKIHKLTNLAKIIVEMLVSTLEVIGSYKKDKKYIII
ncbi:MAG: hypothetical protein AB8U25_06685 [Rickettsiales endosymbiont of Dermacentor nuttalli]